MRRILLLLVGAVVGLGAVAVVLRLPLPFNCQPARRLDQLLGGGPAVCLGGKAEQLQQRDAADADRSTCRLVQRTSRGEYQIAARHAELGCERAGPVATGCVTLPAGASADSLARAAIRRLGGTWRLTLIQDPQGMTEKRWLSGEDLAVSVVAAYDGSRTVCVRDGSVQ